MRARPDNPVARPPTARAVRTAVVACIALLLSHDAAAQTMLVRSSDAAPFVEAENALASTLGQRAVAFERTTLPDALRAAPALPPGKVMVAIGTEAATRLRAALPEDAPLVYCLVADPERAGLLDGRPSYGVSTRVPIDTQLGLIAEALPRARQIGMLYRAGSPTSVARRDRLHDALPPGWYLTAVDVDGHPAMAAAIDELLSASIDIVWTAPDSAVYDATAARALLLAAVRRGTPVYGFSESFVRAGAMIGFRITPARQGEQAARLVKALQDTAPGTPNPREPEQPPLTSPVVNTAVAEVLRVNLPQSLLRRAEDVREDR